MIIIGVDPGTTVTGYAIIDASSKIILQDYGCIRPPANLPLPDRYMILYDAITELLQTYKPQALAVETQFVHKNPSSAIKLGMARGVIIVAAKKNNLHNINEYAPKKAKLALTGNGNASKYQVQMMIQHIFQLPKPPTPQDAADAISIAVAHAHAMTSPIIQRN